MPDKGTFAFADVLGLGYRQGLSVRARFVMADPAGEVAGRSGGTLLAGTTSPRVERCTPTWNSSAAPAPRRPSPGRPTTPKAVFLGGAAHRTPRRRRGTARAGHRDPHYVAGTRADFVLGRHLRRPLGEGQRRLPGYGRRPAGADHEGAVQERPRPRHARRDGRPGRRAARSAGSSTAAPTYDWSPTTRQKVIKGSATRARSPWLPSGRTLVAGDLRCTMDASAAVTCRNERTKASFKLGKAGVTLG